MEKRRQKAEKAIKTTSDNLIGLFPGSFNPIHNGHLVIARYMVEQAGMNQVWFIVSPQNPLKNENALAEDKHRLAMVRLAVEENPAFKVSDIEFHLPKPSYTINTLRTLKQQFPEKNFALIIGADNLENIDKWKDYRQILENYLIYVYPRNYNTGGRYSRHKNVTLIKAPLMNISSTQIRQALENGMDAKSLLPEKVNEYINRFNLYKKL